MAFSERKVRTQTEDLLVEAITSPRLVIRRMPARRIVSAALFDDFLGQTFRQIFDDSSVSRIPVTRLLLDMDFGRPSGMIPAQIAKMAHVNFEKKQQHALRRFLNMASKKSPVFVKRNESGSAYRNVTSRKYGRKRPALVVAFVGEDSAQNILVVRN
jgi:hypothetical protein